MKPMKHANESLREAQVNKGKEYGTKATKRANESQ